MKLTPEVIEQLKAAGRTDLIEIHKINQSGYAGVKPNGNIVDRRKFPYAVAVQENPMMDIPKSKPLTFDDVTCLTKENFWDHVWEISHGALQIFCDWIDEYKKQPRCNAVLYRPITAQQERSISEMWDAIFHIPDNDPDKFTATENAMQTEAKIRKDACLKYHELPIGMQLGIMYQFMYEHGFEPELTFDAGNLDDLLRNIIEFFFEQGQPQVYNLISDMQQVVEQNRNIDLVTKLGAKFSQEGNRYCYLYGDNIQEGIAGFGETPAAAASDFWINWHNQKAVKTVFK